MEEGLEGKEFLKIRSTRKNANEKSRDRIDGKSIKQMERWSRGRVGNASRPTGPIKIQRQTHWKKEETPSYKLFISNVSKTSGSVLC